MVVTMKTGLRLGDIYVDCMRIAEYLRGLLNSGRSSLSSLCSMSGDGGGMGWATWRRDFLFYLIAFRSITYYLCYRCLLRSFDSPIYLINAHAHARTHTLSHTLNTSRAHGMFILSLCHYCGHLIIPRCWLRIALSQASSRPFSTLFL